MSSLVKAGFPIRRTMFRTSRVQPRWLVERSFNGFILRNFSRTSSGGDTNDTNEHESSPQRRGGAEGDGTVFTIEMRASGGMRLKAMLQPIQPARRAVSFNGGRLMMALGGKAKCGISNRFFTLQVARS